MSEEIINSFEWYKNVQYKDAKNFIRENMNAASRSFVAIGYYLKYIRDKKLYEQDGYQNIWEFAQAEFGISKSSASRFMAINDRFSIDGNSPILQDRYKDFSSSKLSEMLTMTDEELEQVTVATTRVEIREMKQKSRDKVVAPAQFGSDQIYPKVCKYDGKSNCLAVCTIGAECCAECPERESCNSECGWQEERIPKPSGICIHLPEYPCTFLEGQKLAHLNGVECNRKCCWGCPDRPVCGYGCNASAKRSAVNNISANVDNLPGISANVDELDQTETVEADIIQSDQKYDFEKVSAYGFEDVKAAIRECQNKLASYKDCHLDAPIVKRTKMEMDALQALEKSMSFHDTQVQEQIQPELPILKNNDQRLAWLRNYRDWGIWYQDDNINARYYKYDFPDGSRIVVVEYLYKKYCVKAGESDTEWGSGHYHLIHGSKGSSYSYYCNYFFSPYESSLNQIIEHIKKVVPRK